MGFEFPKKISNPLGIAAITILTALAFWAVNAHGVPGIPQSKDLDQVGILDKALNYSPSEAYSRLTAYGEEGRYAYLIFLERVDSVFPLVYGLFFVTVVNFGYVRIFPAKPWAQKLSLLPLAATIFDYSENCCFIIMLKSYPARLDAVARAANVFTFAKWGFALINILLLLTALLGLLCKKIFRRKINQTN